MYIERINSIIEDIYKCSSHEENWQPTLKAIAECVGAAGAAIIPSDHLNKELRFSSSEDRVSDLLYYEYWWRYNPYKTYCPDRLVGDVSDIEFISDDEMKRHPFYQDFLRKFDRGRTCRFGFAEPSAPEFVFAVQRALNAEPETPDERRVRGILARHISRSLSLSAEIGKTRLLAEGFADLCHRLQCGAALLNGDGGVVLINQKLRGMLGDGVDYLNGRIISGNRDNQNRLDALLKATACGEVQSAHKGFIVLNCPSGQNLIVRAVRLPRESMFHVHEARQSAMLILAYKTGSRETDVSAALRPLGLTAAEIRLAQKIGSGVSPKDAAKSLGISDQYARSLLKVVFRKLNIASQSQLSTLVSGLSGLGDA